MSGKILYIIIDQLRADCLNGALADAVDMPNLRSLMRESVTFNRHYSVTTPCGPARASMFTSLYAMNHRSVQNGSPLSSVHPTIATQMRRAGYDPLLFGYTDTSVDPEGLHPNDPALRSYEGLAPGFSEIVRMRFDDNSSWLADLKAKGYNLPERYWDIFRPVHPDGAKAHPITDPALYSDQDSDTAFLTDRTIGELSVRTHHDWFSTLTYFRPHPPLVAPAPYNTMYQDRDAIGPSQPLSIDEMTSGHPFYKAFFDTPSQFGLYMEFNGRFDQMSDKTAAQLRAIYFGLITELDLQIGRLLDFLRDSGQYDDTLIIITADHGETLGDHHMWGKNNPHNSSFHVPLIIRDPHKRETAGNEVDMFTESIDIAPTILDWVGLEPPLGFNGQSLMPLVEGKTPANWRDHMFAEMDMGNETRDQHYQHEFGTTPRQSGFAILQDKQFKLVHFNGGVKPLLYDIKNDSHEAKNLADDPDHAANLLAMTQKMLDHRMTHAHHALSRMSITPDGLVTR